MKLLLKIFALFALTLATLAPASAYSNGYTYRRTVTIDHTLVGASDHTDFPVLVSGTYTYLKTTGNGGNVQNASGYDIIFTSDAAGSSTLSFEKERYTASTGEVQFWVKVSTVSSSADTVIYMFYGNSGIGTFQGGSTGAAWNSAFQSVWHLPDGSSLTAADSTANANTGTITGATAVAGQMDGAATFNGSTNRILGANTVNIAVATVSAWVYFPSSLPTTGSTRTAFGFLQGFNATVYDKVVWYDPNNGLEAYAYDGATKTTAAYAISANTWYHVALRADGTNLKLFVNGVERASVACGNTYTGYTTANVMAGGHTSGSTGQDGWPEYLDEYRVSNVSRSADWLLAEYNNQNNPATFYAVGVETTLSAVLHNLSLMGVGN